MKLRLLIVLMAAISLLTSAAAADDDANALARKMLEAYAQADTYQASWTIANEKKPDEQGELVTAFDRESRRCFFLISGIEEKGGERLRTPGILQVNDGKEIRTTTWVRSPDKVDAHNVRKETPDPVMYADLAEHLFFPPLDVPLVFGDRPLSWLADGKVTDIVTVAPKSPDEKLLGLKISGKYMTFTVWVDPKTYFIERAEYGPLRYTSLSRTINEKLPDSVFDHARHLKALGGEQTSTTSRPQ